MLLKRKVAILLLTLMIVVSLGYMIIYERKSTQVIYEVRKEIVIPEALAPVTQQVEEIEKVVAVLKVEPNETETTTEATTEVSTILSIYEWEGEVLDAHKGVVEGPSGKETYYNLDMSGVIEIMRDLGYDYKFSIREEDGVKMFGPYIMCAANLELRPIGTIVETSLGLAIVCDTGKFAEYNPTQIDIATNW